MSETHTITTGEIQSEACDFTQFEQRIVELRKAHWAAQSSDPTQWPQMREKQLRILEEIARVTAEWLIKSRGLIGVNNGTRVMTHGSDDFGVFKALYYAMRRADGPGRLHFDTGIKKDCEDISKLAAGYAVQLLLAQLESGGKASELAAGTKSAVLEWLKK